MQHEKDVHLLLLTLFGDNLKDGLGQHVWHFLLKEMPCICLDHFGFGK